MIRFLRWHHVIKHINISATKQNYSSQAGSGEVLLTTEIRPDQDQKQESKEKLFVFGTFWTLELWVMNYWSLSFKYVMLFSSTAKSLFLTYLCLPNNLTFKAQLSIILMKIIYDTYDMSLGLISILWTLLLLFWWHCTLIIYLNGCHYLWTASFQGQGSCLTLVSIPCW